MLTIESLLNSTTTTSNAVEFTKEASFTNNAAEAAEGAAKAESAITWSLVVMLGFHQAHWIKISRQLAMDNTALAAYVNTRMRYGAQRKVETQLCRQRHRPEHLGHVRLRQIRAAHGYLFGALGSTLSALVLIRKMIADSWAAGLLSRRNSAEPGRLRGHRDRATRPQPATRSACKLTRTALCA